MIFLHSSIEIYFKYNEAYDKPVYSDEIYIRERDVNVADEKKNDLDSHICTGKKTYDKMYIWGQLAGWYKQTVKN